MSALYIFKCVGDVHDGQKRWERLSRNANTPVENFAVEEMYDDQESWKDREQYVNEVEEEILAEIWHEQVAQSFESLRY